MNEEITYREFVKQKLISIDEQVKKTNGRVRSLEVWRGVMVGGLAVVTTLIIPIIIYIASHIL